MRIIKSREGIEWITLVTAALSVCLLACLGYRLRVRILESTCAVVCDGLDSLPSAP
jgi:hypothetical protein